MHRYFTMMETQDMKALTEQWKQLREKLNAKLNWWKGVQTKLKSLIDKAKAQKEKAKTALKEMAQMGENVPWRKKALLAVQGVVACAAMLMLGAVALCGAAVYALPALFIGV